MTETMTTSDRWATRHSLLLRARDQKDELAWEEFVSYYKRFIYFLLHQMETPSADIDDLAQDILMKLWSKLSAYDPEKGSFRSWLARVIKNTVLNFRDSDQRRLNREQRYSDDPTSPSSAVVSGSELGNRIEQEWKTFVGRLAMERIEGVFSGKAVRVFQMSLEEATTEEIVSELGLEKDSVYTLRNRVKSRYLKELKALIEELEQ